MTRKSSIANRICILLLTSLCICMSTLMLCNATSRAAEQTRANSVEPLAEQIPPYSGEASVVVNGNVPEFTADEITTSSFEQYGELDGMGRCTAAVACLGRDLMPKEERQEISEVRPTGWKQNKYPGLIDTDQPFLYNRCHMIGFQLTGENANEKNLITGTRYMNVQGMLPYENEVAEYVQDTGRHVMYRVTPVFREKNLLCDGVQIEGYSVEDKGRGISFNVFCYNVQPGVNINYADGSNELAPEAETVVEGRPIYDAWRRFREWIGRIFGGE